MNPRHRLVTWVRFLALTAAHPDRPFEAATVGRAVFGAAPRGRAVTVVRLPRMEPGVALEHLAALVELFDDGLREPLPIACKTSAAYAEALRNGGDPVKAATERVGRPVELRGRGRGPRARSWCSAASCRSTSCSASTAFDAYARRLWDDVLALGAGRAPMTESFDVCGPLPTGVTVLEASAGTGKTFTIAALAARYVAEGIPLEQILMVTFTRMATGELRERVRERLVSAEQGARARAGGRAAGGRRGRALLATGSAVGGRGCGASGSPRALADFDSATIATTHGFCQEVLGGLGVLGDIESDTTFVEDISDLRDEVVDDLYVRRFAPPRRPGVQPRARRWRSRRRRSTTRPRRSSRPTRPTTRSRRCACGWPAPPATSSRPASGAWA